MPGFGWIYFPTTSYIVLTVAMIIYMIKFKDEKQDKVLWIFNVFFFILIVVHYTFNMTNRVFIGVFSLLALILTFYLVYTLRKNRKRDA
ncbi:hypothetical protein JNUCC1_02768 [Lentibacillus sp. JNUCC-1]|uniref:hypothetical protein n=1 Tax=Lentibacillus sp. JNUCC-1 TaxID=2654513 RepID=UPI0012E91CA3|nr:hypothetical protein [Lentibacillus sp. JNUCC-1]MUV38896.1 hypothetical protein [Lentibacillus sp. JNUCC-1]